MLPACQSTWGVFIRFAIMVADRNRFLDHCRKNRIGVGTGYTRLYCPEDFQTAHEISNEIVYLPFGNGYTGKDIDRVINVVNSYK